MHMTPHTDTCQCHRVTQWRSPTGVHGPAYIIMSVSEQGVFTFLVYYIFQCEKGLLCLCLPFKSSRCIKASFYIPENRLNFLKTKVFRTKIFMKLVCQYMTIFFNFLTTSNHLHPPQVENCDSNSRLVVDEDNNGKFRPERVRKARYFNPFIAETDYSRF